MGATYVFSILTILLAMHTIRPALIDDLAAITAIYNHYVTETIITFDIKPFETEQRRTWFDQFTANSIHQCLVIESEKKIVGYASSSSFRPKPAYRQSVEATIYLHPDFTGLGLGKLLYQALFNNLEKLDVHRCYGIIALPNPGSIRLHESFVFKTIGTLTEVGFKFGKYHDTLWMEKRF